MALESPSSTHIGERNGLVVSNFSYHHSHHSHLASYQEEPPSDEIPVTTSSYASTLPSTSTHDEFVYADYNRINHREIWAPHDLQHEALPSAASPCESVPYNHLRSK